jgi:hypothetical protein
VVHPEPFLDNAKYKGKSSSSSRTYWASKSAVGLKPLLAFLLGTIILFMHIAHMLIPLILTRPETAPFAPRRRMTAVTATHAAVVFCDPGRMVLVVVAAQVGEASKHAVFASGFVAFEYILVRRDVADSFVFAG